MKAEEKKLLTIKEMAKYLSISEKSARRILKRPGCMFCVRIGYRLYANKTLLDMWVSGITGLQ